MPHVEVRQYEGGIYSHTETVWVPDAFLRAAEEFDRLPECEECDDAGVIEIKVAGPDQFGNYTTDEIPCPECQEE